MKSNLANEEKETIDTGKFTYIFPAIDDELCQIFEKMFPLCGYYKEAIGAKFRLVMVEPMISKSCMARIYKTYRMLKAFSKVDYIIEFSKLHWDQIDTKTKETLMFHELEHIIVRETKDGKLLYLSKQHDVQDFKSVIEPNGIDWAIPKANCFIIEKQKKDGDIEQVPIDTPMKM